MARYHPDEFPPAQQVRMPAGKGPLRGSVHASALAVPPSALTVPSAPPYECQPRSFSFLPEKVRRSLSLAFPVFEGTEGSRIHAPVEFTSIKDLAKSVIDYGINASFTLAQLDRLAFYAMTPTDWQTVAKAVLNPGQYLEWKALWYEASQEQARANAVALTPEQRNWSFEMLTGQGPFAADQTNFPWGVYQQVSLTAIRAWKGLSKKGEGSNFLTKIIQGPQEPFSDFVARMTEAAGRIFGDPDAAAPLIERLVFEQATQECRAAIAPRKSKGLQDWLRVCRDLGGPLTNTGLAAAILQAQKQPQPQVRRTCYKCGKPGHMKKDCWMCDQHSIS